MKTPVLISLPFLQRVRAGAGAGEVVKVPRVNLPFPEDAAKAKVDRYRRLFATLATNTAALAVSSAGGVLTHAEALAAVERHVRRLQADLQALERQAVERDT